MRWLVCVECSGRPTSLWTRMISRCSILVGRGNILLGLVSMHRLGPRWNRLCLNLCNLRTTPLNHFPDAQVWVSFPMCRFGWHTRKWGRWWTNQIVNYRIISRNYKVRWGWRSPLFYRKNALFVEGGWHWVYFCDS